ncbi:MAG: FimV/HubP family polar landmark protein [Halieaceae bacterium]|jgi:pilus assembly protein FimV|nr:FimV/HubP family polar landmark protein [Halieaceae bacterium]
MKRRIASLLVALGLLSPGMAAALGLGGLTLKSYLNEPLQAEVALLETSDLDPSQIRVRLATREDFARAGVDRAYFLTSMKFEVEQREDDSMVLIVTSADPVREPYLDFIVEARWPAGRLLREYTLLLDPPIYVGDDTGITARARVPVESGTAASRTGSGAASSTAPSQPAAQQPTIADRNYAAGTQSAPTSGGRYLVQRSDTLWGIAAAARPGGASVQQTMLDIQRLNREAFIAGNINQLKAGYVLQLPSADQITTPSREQAIAEIERQTQRWQDAAAGELRMDASEDDDAGSAAGSTGEGRLEIAGVEDATDSPAAGGDISARMEDLDRVQRENADLSNRLSAMEDQMAMQERLIALKDEQIAALQASLTEAGKSAEIPETELEGTIEPLEPAQPQRPAATDAAEAETAAPAVERPAPAPAPPRRAAPEPTLVDMLMANLLYVAAGLLIIVLLVVLALRNRLSFSMPSIGRGKAQPAPSSGGGKDDDEFADVSLSDESLIVDEVEEGAEKAASAVETVSSYSSAPDEEAYAAQFETGDALAEADIYIAYGRFPQAVDLLKTAISIEPANTDYRFKLMEACIEMVESAEFQQQYADLQVIGDENVLARARGLLEAVDGGEVWLQDLPPPSITPEQVEAAQAAAREQQGAETVDLGLDDPGDLADETALEIDDSALESLDIDTDDIETAGLDDSLELDDNSLELDDDSLELDDDSLELDADSLALDDDSLELDDSITLDDESPDPGEDASSLPEADAEPEDELSLDLDAEPAGDEDYPDLASASLALDDDLDLGVDDDAETVVLDDEKSASPSSGIEDTESVTDVAGADEEDSLDDLLSGFGDDMLETASDTDDDSLDLGDFDDEDSDFDLEFEDENTSSASAGASSEGSLDLPDLDDLDSAAPDDEVSLADGLDDEDDDSDLSGFGDLELEDSGEEGADSDLDDLEMSLDDDGDLGGLSDDLASELDGADIALDDDGDDDLAGLELDMSDDDGDAESLFAADGDEIDTKLDLARAYVDMGDHDGARSILSEVMGSGNESQQKEAQALLEGLD